MKGISILSEIILAVGIIAAASIFFIIGYNFLGYETTQSYSFTQTRFLEDLGNKIDTAYAFKGITTVQYKVPIGVYTLKGQNNTLILKTPGKETDSYKLFSGKLKDFEVSDKKFLCLHFFNKTVTVEGGNCSDLGVGKDFCADSRCVDGVCTPEYGETCKSPDCNCSSNICAPDYSKKKCLDEKGCVDKSCVGVLKRNDSCEYDWECGVYNGNKMSCKPSKINPSNKGCCPPDEVWNGTQCTIGCLGDPCDSNEECGTAGQCGTSKDLKCNPTTTEFSGYEKACCPDYKEWNGTDCVEACPPRINNPICTPHTSPWSPQTIRYAYDIEPFIKAGFDGSGQTIAIIDWCGDPDIVSDVNIWNQQYGLPPIDLDVIHLGHCNDKDWAGETALDVEWSHAIAPGAKIKLIILQGQSGSVVDKAINYINDNLPGAIVSMSFGGGYVGDLYSLFDKGNSLGTTFVASTGDWCAYNSGYRGPAHIGPVSYPAGISNVFAVSGTTSLSVNNKCQYESETAWNCVNGFGTGGNPSGQSEPSYQKGINKLKDNKRGYGDVSLIATNLPLVSGGSWGMAGGTSFSAPMWAGIIAVLRSSGLDKLKGNINPIIYNIGKDPTKYKKAFHDITSGSNAYNGKGFSSRTGWDYPTGWGTPDVVGLCEALYS